MVRCNFGREDKRKMIFYIITIIIMISMPAMGGIELAPKPMGKVTPELGVLYAVDSKSLPDRDYNYIYEIDIKENMTNVTLQICDNETQNWLNAGSSSTQPYANASSNDIGSVRVGHNCTQPHSNSSRDAGCVQIADSSSQSRKLTYKVNLSELFKQPFLGKTKYRLKNGNTIIGNWEWYGPEIIVNFKNETAIRNGTYRYDYSVDVRASSLLVPRWICKDITAEKSLPVNICYKNESDIGYSLYEPQYYSSKEEKWTTLVWKDAPPFWRLEFVACPKESCTCQSEDDQGLE